MFLLFVVVNVSAMKIDGGCERKRIKRHRPFILFCLKGRDLFWCVVVRRGFFFLLIKLPQLAVGSDGLLKVMFEKYEV